MRKLVIGILLASLLWSGYWVIGARRATEGTRVWFSTASQDGWDAGYGDVRTRGYPNRLDTTITAPRLTDPTTGFGWTAPFLQILRLSYKPEHLILIFPDTQTFTLAGNPVSLSDAKMQASMVFARNSDAPFDHANLVANDLTLTGGDWSATIATALIALRKAAAQDHAYDLGLDLTRLRAIGSAPATLDHLRIDATITLDAPITAALTAPRPAVTRIALNQILIQQGKLTLTAEGAVDVETSGTLTGTVTLHTDDLAQWLDIGLAAGVIPDNLAKLAGTDVTITFANGRIRIGDVDLGQSPRLR